MDLDEFIKITLVKIIKGVEEAGTESKGKVAPRIGNADDDPKILRTDASHGFHGVFLVDFDVAVTAIDKSETGGGAGAKIYVATVEGKKSKTTESSSVQRIKFSVPISYQAPNRSLR